jgi:phosphoglycolate phosphatase-like HAD superfamily hydrolase
LDGVTRVVVWDVDDVLNDLMGTWLKKAWAPAHPERVVQFNDLRENPPLQFLGMVERDYLASLDAFRTSADYAEQLPNPAIRRWLDDHGPAYRHVALTATSLRAAPATAEWTFRHFGRWIREFVLIPAHRIGEGLPIYDADKGAWLNRLGRSAVLVDDSLDNLRAAEASGAAAVRWPRPWNGDGGTAESALEELTELVRVGVPT